MNAATAINVLLVVGWIVLTVATAAAVIAMLPPQPRR